MTLWCQCVPDACVTGGTQTWRIIFVTMVSKLVSQYGRSGCSVSIARRWQVASHWHQFQIAWHTGPLSRVKKSEENHWAPWHQPDLWQLGGCGPPPSCHPHLAASDFHLFGPLKKHLTGKWCAADTDFFCAMICVWVPLCHGVTVA
jgi:hypothetical protein